jgi:hypothetical protein
LASEGITSESRAAAVLAPNANLARINKTKLARENSE